MILSRLGNAFKRQDWFVVVVEIFTVVIGIFIGLQVDDWNEARKDRALEREYLERLYADIEYTFEERGPAEEWDNTRTRQQALILNALRSGTLAEEDRQDFETGLAFFGFTSGIIIRWTTVDELRSTGDMKLIHDVALRSKILNLDATIDRRQAITGKFIDSIYVFREQIGKKYGILNYEGDYNQVQLTYDFQALAADPAFINALSQIDFMARFRVDLTIQTLADLRAFKDDLAAYLGKQKEEAQ